MRRAAAALVLCASCGRLGFSGPGDSGAGSGGGDDGRVFPDAPADMIVVRVTDLRGPTDGQPSAGIHVLFESAAGAVDDVVTDAAGVAADEVSGPTAIHVVRPIPGSDPETWRVDSYLAIQPGATVRSGGDGSYGEEDAMTFDVPPYSGADGYGAVVAKDCDLAIAAASAPFNTAYASHCDGRDVDLYATAYANIDMLAWGESPTTRLADGGSLTLPVTWSAPVVRTASYTGVPAETYTLFFAGSGANTVELSHFAHYGTGAGNMFVTTTATIGIAPTLMVSASEMGNTMSSRVDPYPPAGPIDGTEFPPFVTGMTASNITHRVTWSVDGPTSGFTFALSESAYQRATDGRVVAWLLISPPDVTDVRFPDLPPSLSMLAADGGATWQNLAAAEALFPGTDYATFVQTAGVKINSAAPEVFTAIAGVQVSLYDNGVTFRALPRVAPWKRFSDRGWRSR